MVKPFTRLMPAFIVVLVLAPIYLLRIDHVVGMVVDDAWYVLLAKALADGRGYELINAPLAGIRASSWLRDCARCARRQRGSAR
jgi:hypothetical protein